MELLTVMLSPEAQETIQQIADQRGGVPVVEVIRRALGTEWHLIEACSRGESEEALIDWIKQRFSMTQGRS